MDMKGADDVRRIDLKKKCFLEKSNLYVKGMSERQKKNERNIRTEVRLQDGVVRDRRKEGAEVRAIGRRITAGP